MGYVLVVQTMDDRHSSDVADALLSSVAHVSLYRRRYRYLYAVLRCRHFSPVYHGRLQQLWFDGHYAEAEAVRQRQLSAVDKYRIRRRNPPPNTIWDGEGTVYCFKVSASRKQWRRLHRARGHVPPLLQMAEHGGGALLNSKHETDQTVHTYHHECAHQND